MSTDITTGLDLANLRVPTVSDREASEAMLRQAQQRLTQLQAEVAEAEAEQITDGGDSRLTDMWDRATEVANDNDMCQVFDEIAEIVGAPTRIQTFDVLVTLTVEVSLSVESYSISGAEEWAEENIDSSDIAEAVHNGTDWRVTDTEVY